MKLLATPLVAEVEGPEDTVVAAGDQLRLNRGGGGGGV